MTEKTTNPRTPRRLGVAALLVGLLLLGGLGLRSLPAAADSPALPAPAADEPTGQAASETTVLAGGCFWGVQGVFQHVKGVTRAVSGYAGGEKDTAHYEMVGTGETGHAESVQITFDPRQITYGRILQIYFSVAHDPTELNHQGPDEGTQYRSTIFAANAEQAQVAKAYIAQLGQAHLFNAPIVTTIEQGRSFYPAEDYHQDYATLHPYAPYILFNDLPKVENLRQLFANSYRDQPVLVLAAGH